MFCGREIRWNARSTQLRHKLILLGGATKTKRDDKGKKREGQNKGAGVGRLVRKHD